MQGVPLKAHRIAIGSAIFSGRASILGDEPREHFAKNRVGVFHANLFVGLPERDRNKVEEGVDERRVHVDDAVALFLGQAVRRFDGSAGVHVDGTGIIGHIGGLREERIVVVGIRFHVGVVRVECVSSMATYSRFIFLEMGDLCV